MEEMTTIEVPSATFGRRFADLLVRTRRRHGLSLRSIAQSSGGRLTKDTLRELEEGTMALDEDLVEIVAELYGADIGEIIPPRLPIAIVHGQVIAGGVSIPYDSGDQSSLLTAYVTLIRALRREKRAPTIALRREDIDVLADHLRVTGEQIVDQLAEAMGASRAQRLTMAGLFAAGVGVIGLAGEKADRRAMGEAY